jgi:hypothetical protein
MMSALMLSAALNGAPQEIPPWLRVHGENPYLRELLEELFANQAFAGAVNPAFSGTPDDPYRPYRVTVGGRPYLDEMQKTSGGTRGIRWDPGHGAISIHGAQPDSSVHQSGMVVDLDRLHKATRQDSTAARGLVRDALLHEFAHLLPLAESRHMRNQTGDPDPRDPNAAQHPVIQGENRLRGLFGLSAKTGYGLLGAGGGR